MRLVVFGKILFSVICCMFVHDVLFCVCRGLSVFCVNCSVCVVCCSLLVVCGLLCFVFYSLVVACWLFSVVGLMCGCRLLCGVCSVLFVM